MFSERRASPRCGRPGRRVLFAAVAVAFLSTACGGAGSASRVAGSGNGPLTAVCPATVVVQTSWYPESTHGGLFQLLGPGYAVDAKHKRVTGRLYDRGRDTGLGLEIRAGGPALGNQPVSALMKLDPTITLGQQATEDQVLGAAQGQPTLAVIAPFQQDPVVYIWDPGRHPAFNTISDIGQTNTTVFTFHAANSDYLTGTGILRSSQLNYSYDGSPSWFMGKPDSVVGGFSTNEPYIYRQLGRHVAYAYVAETNYPDYRNTLTVRSDAATRLAPCLRQLVPVLQRGMVDFMARPDPVLKLIVELDRQYTSPFPYPIGQARYGVDVMRKDGLVGNGTDGVFGSFQPDRLTRMVAILRPVYAGQHLTVPADLSADDLATNTYLDPAIRLPNS
jgi:hypothetical protein